MVMPKEDLAMYLKMGVFLKVKDKVMKEVDSMTKQVNVVEDANEDANDANEDANDVDESAAGSSVGSEDPTPSAKGLTQEEMELSKIYKNWKEDNQGE